MHVICDTLVHPSGLAVADFTHDSMPDIMAGSYSQILDWFENNGTGTGMETMGKIINVDITRDPASGNILLRFFPSNSERMDVRLIDFLGRTCYDSHTCESDLAIPVSRLSHGLYLLQIQSTGFSQVSKVLIE